MYFVQIVAAILFVILHYIFDCYIIFRIFIDLS